MKDNGNFNFHLTTEIVFGRNAEDQISNLIKKYGGTKVMLVYGGGSVKRSGLYDKVAYRMKAAGIPFVDFGGAKANPRRSHIEEGLRIAKESGADFFLGIGGASVIDTAKTLAIAAANEWEYWKFYTGAPITKMAPVGTIHTIAAAGSEMSISSVLVDDIETGFKHSVNYEVCRPKFAVMNPELTYTLPAEQTAAGAVDIFSHTYMRYFTIHDSFIGDKFCESIFKTVLRYTPVAIADPENYEARAELMLAGAFSHNGITGIGRPAERRGGEHPLEHQLSAHYDTTHGAGLAVMMPALLRYALEHGSDTQQSRLAQFATDIFNVHSDMKNINATAKTGIERFESWLQHIGMPITLKELGIPKSEIDKAAERCISFVKGCIKGWLELDANAIREIYHIASGRED